MMRNRYGGNCYRCGDWVEPGSGHFERRGLKWLVQHAGCAIAYRGQGPDGDGARRQIGIDEAKARLEEVGR